MISLEHATLRYRNGKGICDVSFSVPDGKVTGYIGPNGAGKTTTIRALMGFIRPDSGVCTINDMDCYKEAEHIKRILGYIPGELSFPSGMSCREYLKYQCSLRGMRDCTYMEQLIQRFELDTRGPIKKLSKGMKQKLGVITAFMHDPEILILDEPTSGMDPLMQNEFIKLILEEKEKGKTILISSHIFEEVEKTCDNVVMIKDGRILSQSPVKNLIYGKRKGYILRTPDLEKVREFGYPMSEESPESCIVYIKGNETAEFFRKLGKITVLDLNVKSQSLEDIFLHFYESEEKQHEHDHF